MKPAAAKAHVVTIVELARPRDGVTHLVRTPALCAGLGAASLADARKVASGYQPADDCPVRVIEKLRTR